MLTIRIARPEPTRIRIAGSGASFAPAVMAEDTASKAAIAEAQLNTAWELSNQAREYWRLVWEGGNSLIGRISAVRIKLAGLAHNTPLSGRTREDVAAMREALERELASLRASLYKAASAALDLTIRATQYLADAFVNETAALVEDYRRRDHARGLLNGATEAAAELHMDTAGFRALQDLAVEGLQDQLAAYQAARVSAIGGAQGLADALQKAWRWAAEKAEAVADQVDKAKEEVAELLELLKRHLPEILRGLGVVAGVLAAVVGFGLLAYLWSKR